MKQIITVFLLAILSNTNLLAQGCSDAGVCSIGGETDSTATFKNTFEITYTYGIGLEDVKYNNGILGYTHRWNKKWSGAAQLSYNQANGNFGTLGNLGDVVLLGRYLSKKPNNKAWVISLGTKIPLSTGNMKINNIPLPMEYQPSLGTVDGLLSLEYRIKKWNFESAFQAPVVQSNRNSFFDEYSASNVFPTTNLFRRKSDVLIRAGYNWKSKNEKWTFKPNMMGIYHLGNDTYVDIKGQRQEISNSQGLTINANFATVYAFNKRDAIELNIASPLLVRQIRPDGLTRAFVASVSYNFQF